MLGAPPAPCKSIGALGLGMGRHYRAACHGMAAPGMVWAWAGQAGTIAKAADSVVQGGLVRVHPNVIPP